MEDAYDLVIIGGGSAGLTAAGFAGRLGARTALVERGRMGGDCTWSGCVPSKALIKVARVAHQMRTAGRFGLAAFGPEVDLKAVMSHVWEVVNSVYEHESPEALRAAGLDVYEGAARFIDSRTLEVGGRRLKARRFLICVGARPLVPALTGLQEVDYLTYENIWQLEKLPRHLLVLGAGPIGCEMAQAFHRLGAEVTLVEGGERMLPSDEPDASALMAEVFAAEGVRLRFGAMAESVRQEGDGIHLVAGSEEVVGDTLLVAVGRRPDLGGLGLEEASVDYGLRGIVVHEHLRTSQSHIYAAGDCTGGFQFTHYAGWQAAMAVRNALFAGATRGVLSHVPWTTFTDPEVAHAGLSEEEARRSFGDSVETCLWPMADVDRARAEGDTRGFIKLIHRKNGKLLGVTIVAARAGEMVHEWTTAMECGLRIGDLAGVVHVYPTYSTAGMQAAADIRFSRLMSGVSGRVVRGLVRLMR